MLPFGAHQVPLYGVQTPPNRAQTALAPLSRTNVNLKLQRNAARFFRGVSEMKRLPRVSFLKGEAAQFSCDVWLNKVASRQRRLEEASAPPRFK